MLTGLLLNCKLETSMTVLVNFQVKTDVSRGCVSPLCGSFHSIHVKLSVKQAGGTDRNLKALLYYDGD